MRFRIRRLPREGKPCQYQAECLPGYGKVDWEPIGEIYASYTDAALAVKKFRNGNRATYGRFTNS